MDEVNRGEFVPLYYQLKDKLQEQIETGQLAPGDLLPSESQLMLLYHVSRNTVKHALESLVQEGLIYRVQGKGTFVAKPKIEQSLSGFYSFSKVMRKAGIPSSDVLLCLEKIDPSPRVMKRLGLSMLSQVFRLQRLREALDEPIILENSYIPVEIAPQLDAKQLKEKSLYDVLESQYGVIVSRAKETFEPILIDDYEARFLNTQAGYPGLLLERIAFDQSGRVVEYCKSIVRGDKCRYYTELL